MVFRHFIPDVNVHFIGINTVSVLPTLTTDKSFENQLQIFDFAGLDKKTNQQVMGLGTIKKNSLTSDAVLRWTIPKKWTVADGATVPFAYSVVSYPLSLLLSILI